MTGPVRSLEWKVLAAASATLATIATRRAVTAAGRALGWDPDDATWGAWPQALVWGLAVGAGMGVARVVAQRAAAAGFERVTGDAPPVLAASS